MDDYWIFQQIEHPLGKWENGVKLSARLRLLGRRVVSEELAPSPKEGEPALK